MSSLVCFWRIKHWEASIRASQVRGSPTSDETERDTATRPILDGAFHLGSDVDNSTQDETHTPTPQELEEMRLQRDLRLAGLL